VLTYGRQEL